MCTHPSLVGVPGRQRRADTAARTSCKASLLVGQGLCVVYSAFRKRVLHVFHLDHMSYKIYRSLGLGDVCKSLVLELGNRT